MIRNVWLAAAVVATVGCEVEQPVFGPSAVETVAVEGRVVEGEAVLTYGPDALPPSDATVSNALRLEVHSSRDEPLVLEFPDAEPDVLTTFAEPHLLNLHDVYAPCDAERCEVVVPFRVVREHRAPVELEISGDAILTRSSPVDWTGTEEGEPMLEIRVL